MAELRPLVLDVDGTFLKTDMLFECFWAGLGRAPWATLKACARHFRHPERLKSELARIAPLRPDLLPVNPDVAGYAASAVADGRDVVLASASDQTLVRALADEYALSESIHASDGTTNLKGEAKAAALVAAYGERGFDYAGDAKVDRKIWDRADGALIVGKHEAIAEALTAGGHRVTRVVGGWAMRDLIRALRPHQWVKNVLLFLPMIAAHEIALSTVGLVLLGIMAFSAIASCIYIVNDLLDLEADRLHPTKQKRPFASGAVPIQVGMVTCAALGAFAIGLAAFLSPAFLAVIIGYMILALAYSLRLKRMRWIDIATLAMLYTIRVIAGAAASGIDASFYGLVFIFPVFITLGCVKRLTELTLATNDDRLPGRGYGRTDRGDLLNVGALGIIGALLIFFLYSRSPQAAELYPTIWMLWVALIPIAIWLIRMLALGYLGRQDYDPIVFAMRDKMGIGLLLITLSLMFYAAGLWAQWFGV